MKFTLDWLKKHVDTKLFAEKIAEALTRSGLEVESYIDEAKQYENFVLGQIIGGKEMKMVCGSLNVKVGMLVRKFMELKEV